MSRKELTHRLKQKTYPLRARTEPADLDSLSDQMESLLGDFNTLTNSEQYRCKELDEINQLIQVRLCEQTTRQKNS